MKKLISLLLVLIICLSFTACAASNASEQGADEISVASKVVGTWAGTSFYGDFKIVLNEDLTGELTQRDETEEITWFVDEATRLVVVVMNDDDYTNHQAFTYLEVKDALYHHEVYCTRVA